MVGTVTGRVERLDLELTGRDRVPVVDPLVGLDPVSGCASGGTVAACKRLDPDDVVGVAYRGHA